MQPLARGLAWALLLLLAFCLPALGKDYYDILQIPRSADDSQIKRAYRKLALQYHPDKATGSEQDRKVAADRFAEIGMAYEALSDNEKRKIYDRYGEQGLKQHEGSSSQGRGGGQDIFSQMFGGLFGGGFGQEEEEQIPKGSDVYVELEALLEELYLGATITVVRDKAVIKPAKGTRQCNCKNKVVTRQVGPGMYQQYQSQECEQCSNVKLARDSQTLHVTIDAGTPEKHQIVMFEEGEPMIDGEAGDLKFVVITRPHARFERDGNDLRYNATISLVEALVGFSKQPLNNRRKHFSWMSLHALPQIEHLDGHKVTLQAKGVTIPGAQQTLPKEGMPLHENAHRHGSLLVTYTVAFPKQLDQKQKDAVRKLFGSSHDEL